MKYLYLVLAVLGAAVPFAAFTPWLLEHGLAPIIAVNAIANDPLSLFAWLDVLISALVLLLFILVDGHRHNVANRIWAALATCTIGVSCGLPLYLYFRERTSQPPW